jgi:hypothetical protein
MFFLVIDTIMISIDTFDMSTDSIAQCLYLLSPYLEVELLSSLIEERETIGLEWKISEKLERKIECIELLRTDDIEVDLNSSREDLISFFDRNIDRGDITGYAIISEGKMCTEVLDNLISILIIHSHLRHILALATEHRTDLIAMEVGRSSEIILSERDDRRRYIERMRSYTLNHEREEAHKDQDGRNNPIHTPQSRVFLEKKQIVRRKEG